MKGTNRSRQQAELCLLPASAGLLLGLLFNPEDGSDAFLQNVGLSQNLMAF
jgi:hypothetical protein